MFDHLPLFLSYDAACRELSCGQTTLKKYIAEGRLVSARPTKIPVIPKHSIIEFYCQTTGMDYHDLTQYAGGEPCHENDSLNELDYTSDQEALIGGQVGSMKTAQDGVKARDVWNTKRQNANGQNSCSASRQS